MDIETMMNERGRRRAVPGHDGRCARCRPRGQRRLLIAPSLREFQLLQESPCVELETDSRRTLLQLQVARGCGSGQRDVRFLGFPEMSQVPR